MSNAPAPGRIGWIDLTVPDAPGRDATALRDFYVAVAGLTAEPLDMGGYPDFVMKASDGHPIAGICHARGPNKDQPSGWMIYFVVPDVVAARAEAVHRGATVLRDRTEPGSPHRYCVVRDPAGAVCALYQG